MTPAIGDRREWVKDTTFVEAVYATGGVHAEGWVIGYYDRPTFLIETFDGREVMWLADLTRRMGEDA